MMERINYMDNTAKRSQAAIEMLTIYSWALLIIGFLIVIAFIIILTNNQTNYLSTSCSIQPFMPCRDSLLTTSPIKYYMTFVNGLQVPMNFTANAINVTTTDIGISGIQHSMGECYPGFALPGTSVVCTANISGTYSSSIGRRVSTFFTLSYYLCGNDTQSSCITTSPYKTSGYSLQSIAPATISYNTLSILIGPGSSISLAKMGWLVINGEKYAGGTNALIPYGNYTVYAQSSAGYAFSTWSILQGTSVITPSTPANSVGTLTFNSASTIEIVYTGAICNVTCTYLIICPAVCSTQVSCGFPSDKCT